MSKDELILCKVDPANIAPMLLAGYVQVYQEVFAHGPWFEWKKCLNCGRHWGKEQEGSMPLACPDCDGAVVEFWPANEVASDFLDMKNHLSACWLAVCADQVVGFAIARAMTVADLSDYLKLDVSTELLQGFGCQPQGHIAYLADLGIRLSYRGRGWARKLTVARNRDLQAYGLKIGVARTRRNPEPSRTYEWYARDGYLLVKEYSEADGRVIQATELSRTVP